MATGVMLAGAALSAYGQHQAARGAQQAQQINSDAMGTMARLGSRRQRNAFRMLRRRYLPVLWDELNQYRAGQTPVPYSLDQTNEYYQALLQGMNENLDRQLGITDQAMGNRGLTFSGLSQAARGDQQRRAMQDQNRLLKGLGWQAALTNYQAVQARRNDLLNRIYGLGAMKANMGQQTLGQAFGMTPQVAQGAQNAGAAQGAMWGGIGGALQGLGAAGVQSGGMGNMFSGGGTAAPANLTQAPSTFSPGPPWQSQLWGSLMGQQQQPAYAAALNFGYQPGYFSGQAV